MTTLRASILFLLTSTVAASDGNVDSVPLDDLLHRKVTTASTPVWTGKYFPTPPPTPPTPLSSSDHAGVAMGTGDPRCDNAKTNLTIDWNNSPVHFTCYNPSKRIIPDFNVKPVLEIENIPKFYSAAHYCMNETITYSNPVPTFGPHRPAWPRYGEYKYLPVQRWLHSLEHGGIVMLYHPCAHPLEVERLRRLVTSCLYRHVISPNTHLSVQKPLALLSWGKRLTMSAVNVEIVKDFIKQNALQGPEKTSRDGQYDMELMEPASIVSDTEDTDLCPEEKLNHLSFFW